MDLEALKSKANDLRVDIVSMVSAAGSGHPGGSLSAVEVMCALYFGGVMRHDPAQPDAADRDRFVLSRAILIAASFRAWRFPPAPWARVCQLLRASPLA